MWDYADEILNVDVHAQSDTVHLDPVIVMDI